jgi:hypothetical protein
VYINTSQLKMHSQRGWWGISHNPEMKFDIIFGRDDYGRTGVETLKTWARKSKCNRPSGQYAAMWRTLMMLHGARYVAMDYGSTVYVEIMDPKLMNQIKFGPKLKDMQVKAKLVTAAFDGHGHDVIVQDVKADKGFQVAGTPLNSEAVVRVCTNTGWGVGLNRQAHATLFATFVSEFGPALTNDKLCDFIEEVNSKRKVHASCQLVVEKDASNRWVRYDATTLIKRKKS